MLRLPPPNAYDRRAFLSTFAGLGLGSTLLPGILWAEVSEGAEITAETIACAEELAGIELEPEQRELILEDLRQQRQQIEALHEIPLPNDVAPTIQFNPHPPATMPTDAGVPRQRAPLARSGVALRERPGNLEELAFLPVNELAELVRTRRVSSTELTRMYLERLRRHDRTLLAVVNLTEQRALQQARAADEEIAGGRYRGPLHGIRGVPKTCSRSADIPPRGASTSTVTG